MNKPNKKNIPKYLYKYRMCNDNAFENLKAGVVWCSTLDKFNDPYEGYTVVQFLPVYKVFLNETTSNYYKKQIDKIEDKESLIEFAMSQLNRPREEVERQIAEQERFQKEHNKLYRDKQREITAVCSFSQDWNNRLMWGHYAKDYTGFCIRYETEQMKRFLHKVKYKEAIYDTSGEIIKIMQSENELDFKKFKPYQMVSQKDKIWSYEKEWRLINPIGKDEIKNFNFENEKIKNKGYLFKLKPSAIFLGTKISKRSSNKLLHIAEEQNLTVNKMVMDEKKYQLKYETIFEPKQEDK